MPRIASSKAVIKTARINPASSLEEAMALDYIVAQEARGFGFKQVVVDAINYRAGHTPEMFGRERDGEAVRFYGLVEKLLGEFAASLLSKIQKGEIGVADNQNDAVSSYAASFMKTARERQAIAQGDDED